jgi:hypothetical protein
MATATFTLFAFAIGNPARFLNAMHKHMLGIVFHPMVRQQSCERFGPQLACQLRSESSKLGGDDRVYIGSLSRTAISAKGHGGCWYRAECRIRVVQSQDVTGLWG